MQEWVRNLKANSIQPVFANPARQVQRLMEAARLPHIIGEEFISVRIHDAVTYCQVLVLRPGVTFGHASMHYSSAPVSSFEVYLHSLMRSTSHLCAVLLAVPAYLLSMLS